MFFKNIQKILEELLHFSQYFQKVENLYFLQILINFQQIIPFNYNLYSMYLRKYLMMIYP